MGHCRDHVGDLFSYKVVAVTMRPPCCLQHTGGSWLDSVIFLNVNRLNTVELHHVTCSEWLEKLVLISSRTGINIVCACMRMCLYSVVHMHRHILLCVSVVVCICGSCEINGQGLPLCLELIPGCAAQINVQWEQELTIRKVLVHFKPSKRGLL